MKHYVIAGLLTLFILPVAVAATLPEGAIKEGTLSNQQLIQDAMTGVAAEVATRGCGSPEDFIPYVMAMPEGSVGSRHWRELWVVKGCGKEFPVEMNFREAGSGAANWNIK
ncbi:hypothetical protein [Oceanimonas baumannii]|uniref:Uncharacterized protein n=1 Tax=Oceanimonas baumannii TaxID=129578 RepID=A0A235CHG6_9GAMM|nr:hypothetical protein [Oceanimonas baumannii]OYD23896.1 hypothetical protein B6S09_10595 [Oceanimonas baumannii]TDW58772.1 hypothetical protein LY04_02124 [Oceanimonas baumannii]